MITFKDLGMMGRLGNQMFQFATLHGVAKRLGLSYGVSFQNTKYTSDYQRLCLNDGFDLDLKSLDIPSDHQTKTVHVHTAAAYDPSIFKIKDGTDISGYYQSPKYFAHCAEEIKRLFTFKQKYQDVCNKFLESFGDVHLASLHVRRTDYIGNDGIFETPLTSFVDVVSKLPSNGVLFVYSDDVNWCKLFLKRVIKYNIIFPCDIIPVDKFNDMYSMTQMNTNIIANSTFSWWGAYLNTKSSAVYIPQKWYKNDDHSTEFYVDGWKRF